MAPGHILSMFRHHVEQLQLVTGILLEFNLDNALFVEDEFDGLPGHANTPENDCTWHLAHHDFAILVYKEAGAVSIDEVLNTACSDRLDEFHMSVLAGQYVKDLKQDTTYWDTKFR